MSLQLLINAGVAFAYISGLGFLAVGIYLSVRRGRLHPLLLLCISALSFSWIEAPYDWAVYAQFPPELPRMPSWWPLNLTWGGLPSAVPVGYMGYFVLPAIIGAALGRWASRRWNWRRPQTLLLVGFGVGFLWAFAFNAIVGARLGLFYYGYVIEGLAVWSGTIHQYPIYDSIAMGLQMMLFTYLLGRTDSQGRNVIEIWADKLAKTRLQSGVLSVLAVIVIGHAAYASVFAPHLITKLGGWVNVGPSEQLFPGVPNQPQ
ncbi:spirocyclase AveC family protein [Mycobacterium sp. DBP42]|uniref:spirocyclase AveC family protein n=1 Tax=Mycobacterium sp. DBP42 TaxID=2545267 RepID=UPI00110CC06C|nr:spirocyclase AveC family protein [Mycobacterium sp. DBP42]TMS49654.1 spirocyclase, AveC family [Mycobacterium sp. DBP42]